MCLHHYERQALSKSLIKKVAPIVQRVMAEMLSGLNPLPTRGLCPKAVAAPGKHTECCHVHALTTQSAAYR